MKILLILLTSLFLTMPIQAATFDLIANGKEPLYQTTLPKTVYQFSRGQQLNDLKVLNASGETVPYAVVPYKSIYPKETITQKSKPLVIFPMQEDVLNSTEVTRIQLDTPNTNTRLNVTAQDSNATAKTYFLFDLGKHHATFEKLSLNWEGLEGKVLIVDVMVSQNLNDWSHVGEAALLKVTSGGQTIVQNEITLNRKIKERYLQIRPQDASEKFKLTAVNLEFSKIVKKALPITWQAIPFKHRENNTTAFHLDFESPSRYPATYLTINLPQQNTITNVTISTRNDNKKPWHRIKVASLYHINKNGKLYTNDPVSITKTTARYWRLSFDKSQGGIGSKNPQLSLGWLSDTLIWNARGNGPYVLEVGEGDHTNDQVSIIRLLKPYGSIKIHQLPDANIRLTSQPKVINSWDTPTDFKRFWLWAGLLLGVIALASMTYTLIKNNPPPPEM